MLKLHGLDMYRQWYRYFASALGYIFAGVLLGVISRELPNACFVLASGVFAGLYRFRIFYTLPLPRTYPIYQPPGASTRYALVLPWPRRCAQA